MNFIDKDILLQRINTQFWSEIENIINSAPSINIVRCKECKHAEYRDDHDEYLCREDGYVHDVDWFCADGERREPCIDIDIVFCSECKLGGTEDCPMDEIDDEYFCISEKGESRDTVESLRRCRTQT